ncbi:MAG TPA: fibronectin type III domain-containing protein, partial [Prolixibacteraceae bacterium]
ALTVVSLTTTIATNITSTTATLGGEVTSDGGAAVTERGICYSLTANPTTSSTKVTIGTGIGSFTNTITGLAANTTYFVRAYAINSQGTAYGSEITFKTSIALSAASLTTTVATNITSTTVTLGGEVTSDGGAAVTERGICYSLTANPTTSSTKVSIGTGTGSYSNSTSGLTANTTYYVRAYAINSQGTAYGSEITFKTSIALSVASLTTTTATNITSTSATLGGNVTSDGGAAVTERGICYSTTTNPTTSSFRIIIGTGTGSYSNATSGLAAGTTYYVRAYAINSQGTAYGNEINLTTLP